MEQKTPGSIKRPLAPDFDPTEELWDRIVDDIIERGAPCVETVEELVEQACQLPANPSRSE